MRPPRESATAPVLLATSDGGVEGGVVFADTSAPLPLEEGGCEAAVQDG